MIILFYPEMVRETNKVWQCCKANGHTFHNDPSKPYHIVFYWSYTKTIWRPDKFYLKLLAEDQLIVNNGCRNIGKDYVELVFESVFGYSSCVNPKIHRGKIVEKTIKQDNKAEISIVNCPRKSRRGFIYQKVLDFGCIDFRVFVGSGKAQFVLLKYKTENSFKNNINKIEFSELKGIFSSDEITNINAFIFSFGLDFGEIDVLRHKDGKIYIIDVNNIAGRGAFLKFDEPERTKYLKIFHDTFQQTIDKFIVDAH